MQGETMRIASLLGATFFCAAIATAQSMPQKQPMAQMHGGCDNYRTNLTAELQLMAMTPAEVTAGASAGEAPALPQSKAVVVSLLPQSQVRLAAPPAQDRGGADRRAGLVSLGALSAGDWRVSLGSFAWIDAVASGRLLPNPSFEMQSGCAAIFKTVVFHVSEAEPVILQLSGADTQSIRVLLTPAAQDR
jgi:hypothetical protein